MTGNLRRPRTLARGLERWFATAARDLPWRKRRNGYRALVAEAMLQQTQADRVAELYPRFLKRFPTVRDLAAASEQDVLALWQGLGYYRRARNLRLAAQMVVRDFGGRVPSDPEKLAGLPGVGRYTAGAIASIAFGVRTPIVDGNVYRVLARWSARPGHPREQEAMAWAWREAEAVVDTAETPGVLNEALMELGATVCTPRRPLCEACPVARGCRARAEGLTEDIPAPAPATKRTDVYHHAVLVRRGDRILLEQRPETGLWSSLWQPPTIEDVKPLGRDAVGAALTFPLTSLEPIGTFEHLTTHRRVVFHVLAGRTRVRRGSWRAIASLASLPMSSAHRRLLKYL